VDFVRSIHGAICSHVRSPHLRQLLGRYATYLGASPYRARAMFNVIAHVELTAGLWYPRGGTYTIARAYRRLAEELGVEIRTATPVSRIVVRDGAVVGVELADGVVEMGSAVVSNVDVVRTHRELLPSSSGRARRLHRWMRGPFSCSGFLLLLGVDGQRPQLGHHNIFFSSDYRREFADIFRRHIPPAEPTIYVAITSKTDPQHAPEGGENWFVMVNVPPVGPEWDWIAQGQGYRDRVLARLAELGIDVRGQIHVEQVVTPLDLATQSAAWRGALYGLSFNQPLAPLIRPGNRSADVRGLYFAGGTAHPGGGVPLVTLSGKTAARMVLQDSGG
jgi:phytoene desaturase